MNLPTEVAALYPFESQHHQLGNVRMHYLDEGAGKPLLMVHGNPTWSFYFRNLIQEFRPRRRCVAPDHIGCGLSDKPQNYRYCLARHAANLESLILNLDLRDIDLLVHDWGGPIGLSVATRHPERFDRIMISNTAAFRSKHLPRLLWAARIPLLGEFLIRGFNAFVQTTLVTATAHPHRMRGAVRKGFTFPYSSWANRIATARFVQDIPMDASHPSWPDLVQLEQGLPRLRNKQMLLLWGEKDWCFTTKMRDQFLDIFPHAKSVGLRSAHHLLYEDEPETTLQVIKEFLE
ncbi:alpha/beta fold hydrolase [bacterium]|nr:alpha/beta fold hydrolase [bacterium]